MYEVLHKDVMTMPEASFVMHELRCLIEDNENWKEKLRLLHFYCDWSVHSQIDRQWHCETFIRDLNKTLWQLDESGQFCPEKHYNMAQFLKIPQLLQEIELLFQKIIIIF